MNWELIGATGEWAGALVVVVTLFYLARQIGLSNRLALAEADRTFLEGWTGALDNMGSDTTTASIMQRGLHEYVELSQPEKFVFHIRMAGAMNKLEVGIRLKAQGLVSQEVLDSILDSAASGVLTDGGSQWWSEAGPMFSVHEVVNERCRRENPPLAKLDEISFFQIGPTSTP